MDSRGEATVVWVQSRVEGKSVHSVVEARTHLASGSWGRTAVLASGNERIAPAGREHLYAPEIALDERGDAAIAYFGKRNRGGVRNGGGEDRGYLMLSTRRRGGHGYRRTTLARTSEIYESAELQVATDARGETILAWQQGNASDGRNWVQALVLGREGKPEGPSQVLSSRRTTPHIQLSLAVDAVGAAVLAWRQEGEGGGPVEVATRLAGRRFVGPRAISGGGRKSGEVADAIDSRSNATVVFTEVTARTEIVEAAAVEAIAHPAHGGWSNPVALSLAGRRASELALGADSDGELVAVWSAQSAEQLNPPQPFPIEASIQPAGGTWQAPVTISLGFSSGADVTVGANGQATAAWLAGRGPSSGIAFETADYVA
jgi:hypothetical protein